MPAPEKELFEQLTKTIFASRGIVLPVGWKSMGKQFMNAFRPEELNSAPNPENNLFREATLNRMHVTTARKMSIEFERYIDGVCGSVCRAISFWMGQAVVAGIMINGPVGTLMPGNVTGPDITWMIYRNAPGRNEYERRYSNAIAKAIGSGWQMWHMGLTGMLPYPEFAAVPGPVAPPTVNVPVPVMSLMSSGEASLSPGVLKDRMRANLGSGDAMHADVLFDSISKAFFNIFQTFKTSTLVQNVQGQGPVPSFSTTMTPGPVVAGTCIPSPGVFV